MNTSEFNDPRIKRILKKLYSKVNSKNTEEKVQKEYIDTQIELFTGAGHREKLNSNSIITILNKNEGKNTKPSNLKHVRKTSQLKGSPQI